MPNKLNGSKNRLLKLSLTIALLSSLILGTLPTSAVAQDTTTQSYTTADGLTFAYPDGWGLHSTASQVFIASNAAAQSRNDLGPNDVYAIIMSEQNLAQLFGHFDDLNTAAQTVSGVFTAGAQDLDTIALTINDHPAIRYDFEDEHSHSMMVFLDIDAKIVTFIASTPLADFTSHEPTLLSIIESMQYAATETSAPPDDTTSTTESTSGTVVWQRQYEISNNFFGELGKLQLVSTNDETIYVSDSVNIVQLTAEGNITDFRTTDVIEHIFSGIAADSDGSIWAGVYIDDVLMHFSADNAVLGGWNNDDFPNPIFGNVIPIDDIALGPDGNLYIFTIRFDEAFNGESYIMVWSNTGEFLYDFVVSDTDELGNQRFTTDTYISFTPEGNILLVELSSAAKIVDTQGNIVKNDFPQGFGQSIYSVNDVIVGLDGSIYLADYMGIYRFDSNGTFIETLGTPQAYDPEPPPFADGEFSAFGPTALALMSNGDIIAVDSNETYNLIVRLAFTPLTE
jgi:hypothetical protein